jgi:hypothetical protein
VSWLLRLAYWLRHPPSPQRVRIILVVIAICGIIAGIEALGLWPDWATRTQPSWLRLPR